MNGILQIENTLGFSARVVDAPAPDHFIEARVAKGIEIATHVSELIEVQDDVRSLLELARNSSDKTFLHHGIGIADDADIATTEHDPDVVHQMLVVVASLRHFQQHPGIDLVLKFTDSVGLA